MKVGDLIKYHVAAKPPKLGIVVKIDVDYYGAGQAFKHLGRPRGHCVDSTVADTLAPTKHGKQDRVLVRWIGGISPEYIESRHCGVISASR